IWSTVEKKAPGLPGTLVNRLLLAQKLLNVSVVLFLLSGNLGVVLICGLAHCGLRINAHQDALLSCHLQVAPAVSWSHQTVDGAGSLVKGFIPRRCHYRVDVQFQSSTSVGRQEHRTLDLSHNTVGNGQLNLFRGNPFDELPGLLLLLRRVEDTQRVATTGCCPVQLTIDD